LISDFRVVGKYSRVIYSIHDSAGFLFPVPCFPFRVYEYSVHSRWPVNILFIGSSSHFANRVQSAFYQRVQSSFYYSVHPCLSPVHRHIVGRLGRRNISEQKLLQKNCYKNCAEFYQHRGKTSAHASTLPVIVLRT
jgi:hypothetical protein